MHPVIKTTKDPYKNSAGHASIAPENPKCYLRPCYKEVKPSLQLANFLPYSDILYRTHKSLRRTNITLRPSVKPTPNGYNLGFFPKENDVTTQKLWINVKNLYYYIYNWHFIL
jgi:hypothetical protein